jgi:hypothetical protein
MTVSPFVTRQSHTPLPQRVEEASVKAHEPIAVSGFAAFRTQFRSINKPMCSLLIKKEHGPNV